MQEEFVHIPVMLDECIRYLNISADGTYLDATVGGAGHSIEIAKRLKTGRLICLDKDPDAVAAAEERLKQFSNVLVLNGDFRDAEELLKNKIEGLDGALLDLGVSSYQLNSKDRGFTYQQDSLLDMRMSKEGLSARDIVNDYSREELTHIIYEFGEERYAGYIAKKIVEKRLIKPIETTTELHDIVISALPPAVRRKDKNPARKTFTALRIQTNDELEALREGITAIFEMLKPKGRLAIISFNSLEDRIVKQMYLDFAKGCECPKDFPICVCGKQPRATAINKKPIVASEEEITLNRRARSAKLRILEKV